jgi:hypothetical protein
LQNILARLLTPDSPIYAKRDYAASAFASDCRVYYMPLDSGLKWFKRQHFMHLANFNF